jgi:hypothetical protein
MAPKPKSATEAFSRVKIDALLRDVGWKLEDGRSLHFEYSLSDRTKADYVLCDRYGHAMAVVEAIPLVTAPMKRIGLSFCDCPLLHFLVVPPPLVLGKGLCPRGHPG